MEQIISTFNRSELKFIIHEALEEREKKNQARDVKFYSIHKCARLMKRSDRTIKKLIRSGIIKTTLDNRISSLEIDKLLNPQPYEDNK